MTTSGINLIVVTAVFLNCSLAIAAPNPGTAAPILAPGASAILPTGDCIHPVTNTKLTAHKTIHVVMTLNQKGRLLKELGDNQDITRLVKNIKTSVDVDTPKKIPDLWPTNLDIAIQNADSANYYVPITIRIKPSKRNDTIFLRPTFSTNPQGIKDSSAAVTVEYRGQSRFCDRSDITQVTEKGKTYEQVTFGTMFAAPPTGSPPSAGEYSSFNIGLLIYNDEDKSWYPIYIDPNVQNEG